MNVSLHIRSAIIVIAAAVAALTLAATLAGCSAMAALVAPTSPPTTTPTSTATPTATATSTPSPTPPPTATPTMIPLSLSLKLEAATLQPGAIASLVIETNRPASVTASLRGQPLPLFQESGRWYGLAGIWAATQPGTWPLVITATERLGTAPVVAHSQFHITDRQFEIDAITLTQDTLNLILDAEAVRKEANLVAGLIAPRTPTRLWQGSFMQPVPGEVTTTYGQRRSYNGGPAQEYHNGLDLGADAGTPVAATNAGLVVFSGPLKVRGNTVIIDHGWGLYSGYYHLSATHVKTGDPVQRGQTIGLVGSTGLSTGPHLHWTLWLAGDAIDPAFVLGWHLPE